MWTAGRTFTLIEQDMGLRGDIIPALEACPSLWCGWRYPVGGQILAAFGVVRFRAPLLAVVDMPAELDRRPYDGHPPRHWTRLDVRVMDVLREHGHVRCEHGPPIRHYHQY